MDDTSEWYLTDRERQLLSMAITVSQEIEGEDFDLEADFRLYWESCAADDSNVPAPMTLPDDRLAIRVLVGSGLLPVADEGASTDLGGLGVARVNPHGAIARLVAVMGDTDAA
jgi:hypothetical protein